MTYRARLVTSEPHEPRSARRCANRRGFTLMELLVVIAITAILMTILFIPLSRALDMQARGNAKIQGQNNVRAAMRFLTRDLSNALEILPPRRMQLWGYSAWTNRRNRYAPAQNALPEQYL